MPLYVRGNFFGGRRGDWEVDVSLTCCDCSNMSWHCACHTEELGKKKQYGDIDERSKHYKRSIIQVRTTVLFEKKPDPNQLAEKER